MAYRLSVFWIRFDKLHELILSSMVLTMSMLRMFLIFNLRCSISLFFLPLGLAMWRNECHLVACVGFGIYVRCGTYGLFAVSRLVIVVGWRCRWLVWLIKSRAFVNFLQKSCKGSKNFVNMQIFVLEFYLFEIFVDYVWTIFGVSSGYLRDKCGGLKWIVYDWCFMFS